MELDKYFLLCYTDLGIDGMRHAYHAWFATETELYRFAEKHMERGTFETELAIEITGSRVLPLLRPHTVAPGCAKTDTEDGRRSNHLAVQPVD